MNRSLGLDIGGKVIGVSVSDPLGLTARPLKRIKRTRDEEAITEILLLCKEFEVRTIVVGRPRHLDGGASAVESTIESLVARLRENCSLEIVWGDERLSSKEAERLMAEHRIPISRRREHRDAYSAALILQWYLDEAIHDRI